MSTSPGPARVRPGLPRSLQSYISRCTPPYSGSQDPLALTRPIIASQRLLPSVLRQPGGLTRGAGAVGKPEPSAPHSSSRPHPPHPRAQAPFPVSNKMEGGRGGAAAILGKPTRNAGRHSPRSQRSSPRCGPRARRAAALGGAAGGRAGGVAGPRGAPRRLGAAAWGGRQECLGPGRRRASARLAFCRLWGRRLLGPA